MDRDIIVREFTLTPNREIKVHGHGEVLLNALNKVLNDCIQYPSAIALDFRFLGQSIERVLETSAINIADDETIQASSFCQESSGSDFGLSTEWTTMQRDILDIVAKLSKQSPVNVQQNTSFFRLGLDSISAAQIAASLRQKGWNVNPIEVIEVFLLLHSRNGQNMLTIIYASSTHQLLNYRLILRRGQVCQELYPKDPSILSHTIADSGLTYVFAIRLRVLTWTAFDLALQYNQVCWRAF